MHKHTRFLLLAIFIVLIAACSDDGRLFGPEVNVTPAKAPVLIPGVTPATVVPADEAAPTSTPSPSPTPARTPIRLKVEAAAQAVAQAATATATSTAETDAPTVEPSASPSTTPEPPSPAPTDTPTTTETAAPTETPEPSATPLPPTPAGPTATPRSLDDTLNVLVVGSDERSEGHPWRSDVIMIAAVDFSTKQIGVISFPRDLWVSIPTVGNARINTATFFGELNKYKDGGGIGLLRETISQNFGIRIDHYVKINFESFEDMVDAIGGIDVKVDCPITGRFPREEGSAQLVWQTLQPGEYHMDGLFALRYVRERKTTSDVDRTRRQQRVLVAMRNQARQANIIPKIPAIYDALRQTIDTDLGLTNILSLARLGIQIEPDDAHGFIIGFKHTTSWTTPTGAAVLRPNMGPINEGISQLFAQPSILESPAKPASCPDES